jgi:hypothetical protein
MHAHRHLIFNLISDKVLARINPIFRLTANVIKKLLAMSAQEFL